MRYIELFPYTARNEHKILAVYTNQTGKESTYRLENPNGLTTALDMFGILVDSFAFQNALNTPYAEQGFYVINQSTNETRVVSWPEFQVLQGKEIEI